MTLIILSTIIFAALLTWSSPLVNEQVEWFGVPLNPVNISEPADISVCLNPFIEPRWLRLKLVQNAVPHNQYDISVVWRREQEYPNCLSTQLIFENLHFIKHGLFYKLQVFKYAPTNGSNVFLPYGKPSHSFYFEEFDRKSERNVLFEVQQQ